MFPQEVVRKSGTTSSNGTSRCFTVEISGKRRSYRVRTIEDSKNRSRKANKTALYDILKVVWCMPCMIWSYILVCKTYISLCMPYDFLYAIHIYSHIMSCACRRVWQLACCAQSIAYYKVYGTYFCIVWSYLMYCMTYTLYCMPYYCMCATQLHWHEIACALAKWGSSRVIHKALHTINCMVIHTVLYAIHYTMSAVLFCVWSPIRSMGAGMAALRCA
jgi:hypothetical protein